MTQSIELGVSQVAARVHLRLQRYLEAQYHIRDTNLIEERRLALEEPGGISQRPFVEVTPSYVVRPSFGELTAPALIKELLDQLSSWTPGVGVFPPYQHQAEALNHFFSGASDGSDLIVATGTGSGKTETFLYTILGTLALEASERRASFAKQGVRALLLYPMNALVSDQTARLRRFLGDEHLASLFRERWGRHARFGMYTSRTPYPGVRTGGKDRRHLEALLSYYESKELSSAPADKLLVQELKDRGRWPAKDIVRFFARDLEEQVPIRRGKNAGKTRRNAHWDERFLTQPGDRELLTRHEMHRATPDLLITNYSMLEYMLLRPIERSIFGSTRAWLQSHPENRLLLVLDEAHMYRGVGGAEVGLLIRRLMSRLGIDREKLRCILTSASLGDGPRDEETGKAFARGLTGNSDRRQFAVIRGTREKRSEGRPGTPDEAVALAKVSAPTLAAAAVSPGEAQFVVDTISAALGWVAPPRLEGDGREARQHICRSLTGFGPLELLLKRCSGNATAFEDLAGELFPGVAKVVAERAADGLLALGTFARRTEHGRSAQPLLPTRVHMLFRGLPALHACINPKCTERRDKSVQDALVGRLFTESRTHCPCGGRVYELLTHRDCGAAYLRVFGTGPAADFFWHERGGTVSEFGGPLHELHLLLEEPHPHERARAAVDPVLIDITTGRCVSSTHAAAHAARLCYRAKDPAALPNITTFAMCPRCTRRTVANGNLKIMDLVTKGEQPFANLVREQFVTQLPTKPADDTHPNEGRKALLFSDGRQKAARLARDLPREVEQDSFREAIAKSVGKLQSVPNQAPVLDKRLYAAFVATCSESNLHFFDAEDQTMLLDECSRFRTDYDSDLALAFEMEWDPVPPNRYRLALMRQIGDRYYSLIAACAATVVIRKSKLKTLRGRAPRTIDDDLLAAIAHEWVREMLESYAFDPALPLRLRRDEFAFFEPVRAADALKTFFEMVRDRAKLNSSDVDALREALFEVLTRDSQHGEDSGRLVTPDALELALAHDSTWLQCIPCGHLQLTRFLGACANCGDSRLEERNPEHPYMVARKNFFRAPIRDVLGGARPIHITAEEHTAQLSQRDAGVVYATTEEFELRFQDVPLGKGKPPVDILSCTTTMEVGIDIGSLTAVGLRTVPPQRENYQQRAGRAGRRGTSVSSVLTFAQGGAHDAFYFANPATMISGPPRQPRIKSDNRRLARRHIHSHLLQTFFHEALDRLSNEQQRRLAKSRPGIMSAFGSAADFFGVTDVLSYAQLSEWLRTKVLATSSAIIDETAAWLPPEIAPGADSLDERRRFARKVAEGFCRALDAIRDSVVKTGAGSATESRVEDDKDEEEDEDDGTEPDVTLLDLLFDRGLLPSYAFPTDLCSFVIQEPGERRGEVRVAERPQLSKMQALTEYAPGRLLVVDKKTYRVGGVFVEGVQTASPAAALFTQPLERYVGCPRCAFVRIEPGTSASPTLEGSSCPACGDSLFVREYLDPPGFSPAGGVAVVEGDRDQDFTYASSAQLPELVEHEDFAWSTGAGRNLRHAYREDVVLVVANKGQDSRGFSVCESCGAAALSGDGISNPHQRPFLLSQQVRSRENAGYTCRGNVRSDVFLVHDFRTDILLLRTAIQSPFDFSPKQPWLYDALMTLAEALALAASLHLDIDPGELSAGFRLRPAVNNERGAAEIFLFDTASGGAGYAADAGADLEKILDQTEALLLTCPGNCERSCTNCLRHYGNRFLHPRLDRRLGLELLRHIRAGSVPDFADGSAQAAVLRPLARFLELEGWVVSESPTQHRPLVACSPGGRRVVVGVHPALLNAQAAAAAHGLKAETGENVVLLPDFLVERDLPSAYQITAGLQPLPTQAPGPTRTVAVDPAAELPLRELRRLADPRAPSTTVRLRVPSELPAGAFAARVPTASLAGAGFPRGSWLILVELDERKPSPDDWVVILRHSGSFKATNDKWTIARVRASDGHAGGALKLLYGSATGKEFRPEAVAATDVVLVARVVGTADGEA